MAGRYRSRVSGPLRDRMDMTVRFSGTTYSELRQTGDGEPSRAVRDRVLAARAFAADHGRLVPNARLPEGELNGSLHLDPQTHALLARSVDQLGTTARGVNRILRVARSVADLAASEDIRKEHVGEAIQMRV